MTVREVRSQKSQVTMKPAPTGGDVEPNRLRGRLFNPGAVRPSAGGV